MRRLTHACTLLLLLLATPAAAQITAFWEPATITPAAIAQDPQLAGMQCWDLRVTTSGDWNAGQMRAVLPAGQFFYKNAFGGNTKPNLLFYRILPSLEFTSYVTAPGEFGQAGAPSIQGGFPDGPFSLGHADAPLPGTFSASWHDFVPDPPGSWQIARLTFPLNVFPNVVNIADVGPAGAFSNTSQQAPAATVEVPDIPEPAALGLIATALALCTHRRER